MLTDPVKADDSSPDAEKYNYYIREIIYVEKRIYTYADVSTRNMKMAAADKNQHKIAEHFGFKYKYVVKELLNRERRMTAKVGADILALTSKADL